MPHPGLRRAVKSLEHRGIAATYRLHDRLLDNRQSRRLHAAARPELDALQRDVVRRLQVEGYATLEFSELLSTATWEAVESLGRRFIADTEQAIASDTTTLKRRAGKEFVIRAHSWDGAHLTLEDPWLAACLSDRLLGIANTYLEMRSKLSYLDLWYTLPQPEDAERAASQIWHRDFDDRHLLKAFLYLVDVDERTGPFEYVPGSQPGGRYADLWAWKPLGVRRISDEELGKRISSDQIATFTAPRGTLILCNTSGFHRGGFSTSTPRVLATATYCSPASLRALSVRNYTLTSDLAELSPSARYAIS